MIANGVIPSDEDLSPRVGQYVDADAALRAASNGTAALMVGDMRQVLREMAPRTMSACVTDPPYEINFGGQSWDRSGVAFDVKTWKAVYRVLKPGAFLFAFTGTRRSHRIVCAIEDAGFEILDTVAWLYGQGMPKDYYLKPAHEPIVIARRPMALPTIAANQRHYGTGRLNIDAGRLAYSEDDTRPEWIEKYGNTSGYQSGTVGGFTQGKSTGGNLDGRWPSNVALGHTDDCVEVGTRRVKGETDTSVVKRQSTDVWRFNNHTPKRYVDADGMETVAAWECAPGCPVRMLDEQSGNRRSAGIYPTTYITTPDSVYGGAIGNQQGPLYADTGGASRFYYCAKASPNERRAGLTEEDPRHHTVKPLSLMRWLLSLAVPPGGMVVDPFVGSGTTGCAAAIDGIKFFGVDKHQWCVDIAERRIAYWAARQTV